MAVSGDKTHPSFSTSPKKRQRRSQSSDGSINTSPLDDSSGSHRATGEEGYPYSILRRSSDTVSLTNSFTSENAKKVSFGHVRIYSHKCTLGDNPAVASGPPLTVEWKAFDTHTLDLDSYEEKKPEPRSKDAMILPRSLREAILRKEGFSRGEMKEVTEEVMKIQLERRRSSRDTRLLRQFEKWTKLLRCGQHGISRLEISEDEFYDENETLPYESTRMHI